MGAKPKNTMSQATIESPVASSQLFFAWSEQAAVGIAPPKRPTKKSAPRPLVEGKTPVAPPVPPAVAPAEKTTQAAQRCTTPAGHLSFTGSGRIERPVRMGAVMIKLLKRYGITDAEIAEGVANYARKHQQALAS